MPIRPEHRWLYPIDWPEISRIVRFTRANGRCEHCQHPPRTTRHAASRHRWRLVDTEIRAWRNGRGRQLRRQPGYVPLEAIGMMRKPVFLATAHLNHDPTFSGPRWRNLAALCQRCQRRSARAGARSPSPSLPYGDELLDAVSKAIGIPRDHLVLTATHDHNTPFAIAPRGQRYTGPYFNDSTRELSGPDRS